MHEKSFFIKDSIEHKSAAELIYKSPSTEVKNHLRAKSEKKRKEKKKFFKSTENRIYVGE